MRVFAGLGEEPWPAAAAVGTPPDAGGGVCGDDAGGGGCVVVIELPLAPPSTGRAARVYDVSVREPGEPPAGAVPTGAAFVVVEWAGPGALVDPLTSPPRGCGRAGGYVSKAACNVFVGVVSALVRLVAPRVRGVPREAVWSDAFGWLNRAKTVRMAWSRADLSAAADVVLSVMVAAQQQLGVPAPWDAALGPPRWSLLHLGAAMGFGGLVDRLLTLGADPTRLTRNSHTPLQLAAAYGAPAAVLKRILQAMCCLADPAPVAAAVAKAAVVAA